MRFLKSRLPSYSSGLNCVNLRHSSTFARDGKELKIGMRKGGFLIPKAGGLVAVVPNGASERRLVMTDTDRRPVDQQLTRDLRRRNVSQAVFSDARAILVQIHLRISTVDEFLQSFILPMLGNADRRVESQLELS